MVQIVPKWHCAVRQLDVHPGHLKLAMNRMIWPDYCTAWLILEVEKKISFFNMQCTMGSKKRPTAPDPGRLVIRLCSWSRATSWFLTLCASLKWKNRSVLKCHDVGKYEARLVELWQQQRCLFVVSSSSSSSSHNQYEWEKCRQKIAGDLPGDMLCVRVWYRASGMKSKYFRFKPQYVWTKTL